MFLHTVSDDDRLKYVCAKKYRCKKWCRWRKETGRIIHLEDIDI